jgi:hypothetical protein
VPLANAPVRIENVLTLGPLGSLVPPDHVFPTPHFYFYVKNDTTPSEIESPVFAPADLNVTQIGLRVYQRLGGKTNYPDYQLVFRVCESIDGYFIHLRSLTHPDLAAALAANSCTPVPTTGGVFSDAFCQFPVNVLIASGAQIGTTGDSVAGVGGLDLGLRDYRLPNGRSGFARPDRWCSEGGRNPYDRCYAVCAIDYMPAAERAKYLDRFTDSTGVVTRSDEPRCGTIYHDRAGTARGAWFAVGTPSRTETYQLYLGPDAYTERYQTISMGTSVPGLAAGGYLFRPASSGTVNRPFESVTTQSVACYDTFYGRLSDAERGIQQGNRANLTMLLQLQSGGAQLKVAAGPAGTCGGGPWTMPASAIVFER